jgi:hypothetical protein
LLLGGTACTDFKLLLGGTACTDFKISSYK